MFASSHQTFSSASDSLLFMFPVLTGHKLTLSVCHDVLQNDADEKERVGGCETKTMSKKMLKILLGDYRPTLYVSICQ